MPFKRGWPNRPTYDEHFFGDTCNDSQEEQFILRFNGGYRNEPGALVRVRLDELFFVNTDPSADPPEPTPSNPDLFEVVWIQDLETSAYITLPYEMYIKGPPGGGSDSDDLLVGIVARCSGVTPGTYYAKMKMRGVQWLVQAQDVEDPWEEFVTETAFDGIIDVTVGWAPSACVVCVADGQDVGQADGSVGEVLTFDRVFNNQSGSSLTCDITIETLTPDPPVFRLDSVQQEVTRIDDYTGTFTVPTQGGICTVNCVFDPGAGAPGSTTTKVYYGKLVITAGAYVKECFFEAANFHPHALISASFTTVVFECIRTGHSEARTVTLTNDGNIDLEITSIDGPITQEFAIILQQSVIPPQSSKELVIVFTPSDQIDFNDELFINSNAENDVHYRIRLEGCGLGLDITLVMDLSASMTNPIDGMMKYEAQREAGFVFDQLWVGVPQPSEDRVSLIQFSTTAEVVMGINLQAQLSQFIANLPRPFDSTSIVAAIESANAELMTPRTDNPQHLLRAILLFTDGLDNTAFTIGPTEYSIEGGILKIIPNQDHRTLAEISGELDGRPRDFDPSNEIADETILTEVYQIPQNLVIYPLGLGTQTERNDVVLNLLATATGGYYTYAENLNDLIKQITQLYWHLSGVTVVIDPIIEIASGSDHRIEFEVLEGDNGVHTMVSSKSGEVFFFLRTPQDQLITLEECPEGFQTSSRKTKHATILQVTYPIQETERYSGSWTLVLENSTEGVASCHVAIGLNTRVKLHPSVTFSDTANEAHLALTIVDGGIPLSDWDAIVEITSPSGKKWEVVLHNIAESQYKGVFKSPRDTGSYVFRFLAHGTVSNELTEIRREATMAKHITGRSGLSRNVIILLAIFIMTVISLTLLLI